MRCSSRTSKSIHGFQLCAPALQTMYDIPLHAHRQHHCDASSTCRFASRASLYAPNRDLHQCSVHGRWFGASLFLGLRCSVAGCDLTATLNNRRTPLWLNSSPARPACSLPTRVCSGTQNSEFQWTLTILPLTTTLLC